MKELLEAQLKKSGLRMIKQISSGGLFTSPTYDKRTAYSLEELFKLNREGFSASEDVGLFIFNAIITN